tara:strand:+ start:237 stop:539 length:303 start_codon:yes stop_codon:yes gene_type:complete
MTIQGDTQSTYFAADATTDGQTSTAHRQRLLAVVLEAGSGADATVDIYDAQSATGTPILGLSVAAKGTTSFTIPAMGKICETNIFVDIAGTGASATVYWN